MRWLVYNMFSFFVRLFGYADFELYLKKVGTKINLHPWLLGG